MTKYNDSNLSDFLIGFNFKLHKYFFIAIISTPITFLFSPEISQAQLASDYGKGPITLSPGVTKYYKENYLSHNNPFVFYVNKKGTVAFYSYCPSIGCADDNFDMHKERCEKRAKGEKCYIFDLENTIVWDGPITYETHSNNHKLSDGKTFDIIRSWWNSAVWYNDDSMPTIMMVSYNKYYLESHKKLLVNDPNEFYFALLWVEDRAELKTRGQTNINNYNWIKPVSIKAIKEGGKGYILISHPSLRDVVSPAKKILRIAVKHNSGLWFTVTTKKH